MNFLLAIVLYLIVSFASGVPDYSSTTLGVVSSSMPASSVLQVGDQITKMNGVSVSNWNELSAALDNLAEEGKPVYPLSLFAMESLIRKKFPVRRILLLLVYRIFKPKKKVSQTESTKD